MTTHDDTLDAGAPGSNGTPGPNGSATAAAADQAAEELLDGAAPIDAIGAGDAGEDAAEVVRRLAAQSVATPDDGDGSVGGPWARWKQRTTQGAPIFPLAASTRWHGTTIANGLRPSACPTARAAPRSPTRAATSP